jgi:hypothetical protein
MMNFEVLLIDITRGIAHSKFITIYRGKEIISDFGDRFWNPFAGLHDMG